MLFSIVYSTYDWCLDINVGCHSSLPQRSVFLDILLSITCRKFQAISSWPSQRPQWHLLCDCVRELFVYLVKCPLLRTHLHFNNKLLQCVLMYVRACLFTVAVPCSYVARSTTNVPSTGRVVQFETLYNVQFVYTVTVFCNFPLQFLQEP